MDKLDTKLTFLVLCLVPAHAFSVLVSGVGRGRKSGTGLTHISSRRPRAAEMGGTDDSQPKRYGCVMQYTGSILLLTRVVVPNHKI